MSVPSTSWRLPPMRAGTLPALGRAAGFGETCVVLALALAVTGMPIVAHLLGQPVGILFSVALAAFTANYAMAAVPTTLLCGFLFQNLFVSLVSPYLAGPDEFATARGYNFISTLVMWAILSAAYWTRGQGGRQRGRQGGRNDGGPAVRRLMLATSAVLGLIALYFVLGLANDPKAASIYLRNISIPFLVFQAALIAALRVPGSLTRAFPAVSAMLLAYGYAELLVRPLLADVINADTYLNFSMRQLIESPSWLKELRETGRVIRGIEDMLTFDLFNSPLLADLKIRLFRLQGPNFHSISFAYALALMGVVRLAAGRPFAMIASLPLLVVIGSKGAIVLSLLAAAALLVFAATRARPAFTVLLGFLAVYSAGAIAVGIAYGDYHVVGLFGGLNAFLKNPIGGGLGAGGNLSIDMTQVDWSRSQALGQTDLAMESAVGVLLAQMGIAGLLVWLVPVAIAWAAFKIARPGTLLTAAAFAIPIVAANGLLQEEALFAPLAMGTCMLLAGLAIGEAGQRREPAGA